MGRRVPSHRCRRDRVAMTTDEVVISDNNAEVPNLPVVTPDVLADGGRGLLAFDALAGDWGIAPGPSGKTAWFRLP